MIIIGWFETSTPIAGLWMVDDGQYVGFQLVMEVPQ